MEKLIRVEGKKTEAINKLLEDGWCVKCISAALDRISTTADSICYVVIEKHF